MNQDFSNSRWQLSLVSLSCTQHICQFSWAGEVTNPLYTPLYRGIGPPALCADHRKSTPRDPFIDGLSVEKDLPINTVTSCAGGGRCTLHPSLLFSGVKDKGAVIHLWKKQDVQEASVPCVQWLSLVFLFAQHCVSKAKLIFALTASLVLRVILGSTNWGKAVKHHSTLALNETSSSKSSGQHYFRIFPQFT